MNQADTPVEAAYDPSTGMYVEWAMAETPNYGRWVKEMISQGMVIKTMTVGEMVDWIDANPLPKV